MATQNQLMKRLYSIILLVVFLIGALQPITPMIEYHLYEGSLVDLISSDLQTEMMDESEQSHCPTMSFDCPICDDNDEQELLDTDYYPLAVDITTVPNMIAISQKARIYLPVADDVISPTFLPVPPPPRLS